MRIQSVCDSLAKGGCLVFCDLYLAGVEPGLAVGEFNGLVQERIIKEDCYVLSHEGLIRHFTGRAVKYVRSDTPPKDGRLYIANYRAGRANHFVVKRGGEIVFNSLDVSRCVVDGEPCDYRWIE